MIKDVKKERRVISEIGQGPGCVLYFQTKTILLINTRATIRENQWKKLNEKTNEKSKNKKNIFLKIEGKEKGKSSLVVGFVAMPCL